MPEHYWNGAQRRWDEVARVLAMYRSEVEYEPERYPPEVVDGIVYEFEWRLSEAEGFDPKRFRRVYRNPHVDPDADGEEE